MKKAVVFGGAGFLGSHVADALTDAGHHVRIFDKRPSPYLREDQEMVAGELTDLDAVCKAARGCSTVYNFAAIADIDEARNKPVDTVRFNVLGNTNALEAARLAKAERFVLASSVYVYSEFGSFYRASKQACEKFTETYHDEFGLDYTILRYGSLYGRRADMRNGIYRMLQSALAEGVIRYHGVGDELREYIHVDDAARLSVEILKPEYANMPIILTGHHPMRVRDVVEMVCEMMGGKVRMEFANKPVSGHYNITPYAFHPRVGKKLVGRLYTDMGQGILDCLAEMKGSMQAKTRATATAKPAASAKPKSRRS
ncbi:MAG: NAD(P)-dependent oxidoreductase [Elusimicrobiota bacterium]